MNALVIAETNIIGSLLMMTTMWIFIPITFTIGAIGLYILWCLKRYFYPQWDPKEPPRASFNWPIFGVVFKLLWNWNRLLELDVMTHDKHGDTISFSISPNVNIISTCNPENVSFVLKNIDIFEKGPIMIDLFRPFLGYGIFAVNGELWNFQRKKALHMFKPKKLAEMDNIFKAHLVTLCDKLDKAVENNEIVDLQNLYMRFTMDSIGEIAFGMNLNTIESPNHEFSTAFDWLQAETDKRGLLPLRKYVTFWRYAKELARVNKFVFKLIAEKREQQKSNNDFLSNLMGMVDKDGKKFEDQFLRDVILNFLIAGRDTTAILLSWMTFMLYENRDVELILLNELKSNSDMEYREVSYLRAVIDETLRLFPSVPKNFKRATKDGVFPDGYSFKKGQEIKISAYTVHRRKEIWGDDALDFNPKRWLDKDFRATLYDGKYFPFHGGPRKCLGRNMARREAALVMGTLLQRYEFRPVVSQTITYNTGLTMSMANGYRVKVYNRFT